MPKKEHYNLTYSDKLRDINIELCEEFQGAKHHHKMQCLMCNYQWTATPLSKLQAFKKSGFNGCPNCADVRKYADIRKQNLLKLTDMGFNLLSDYDGSRNDHTFMIKVQNKACGHIFESSAKNIIAGLVNCPICNNAVKINRLQKHNQNKHDTFMVDASDWEQYKQNVIIATRKTMKQYSQTVNPQNLKIGLAGYDDSHHVDHIVSIRYCFEHNIPVEVCADYTNLQVLPWRDNIVKNSKLIKIPDIMKSYIQLEDVDMVLKERSSKKTN